MIFTSFRSFVLSRTCSLGSVGEFDLSSESFTAYLERLDQFFVANDIGKCADNATAAVVRAATQKKVAVMISVIGKKTYSPGPGHTALFAICAALRTQRKNI